MAGAGLPAGSFSATPAGPAGAEPSLSRPAVIHADRGANNHTLAKIIALSVVILAAAAAIATSIIMPPVAVIALGIAGALTLVTFLVYKTCINPVVNQRQIEPPREEGAIGAGAWSSVEKAADLRERITELKTELRALETELLKEEEIKRQTDQIHEIPVWIKQNIDRSKAALTQAKRELALLSLKT